MEASQEPEVEESVLIVRARAGDCEAFASIYERHVTPIYRYVYYLVTDRAEAEDLTSQTFLNAWRAMPKYRDEGKPIVAWLFRISRNLALAHLRRRRVHANIDDGEWEDKSQSVSERVTNQVAVTAAIAQLPPTQQQVIILRFAEGMEYSEVARLIGKAEGAVRVIQFRALKRLGEILGQLPQEVSNARSSRRRQGNARTGYRPAQGPPAQRPPIQAVS